MHFRFSCIFPLSSGCFPWYCIAVFHTCMYLVTTTKDFTYFSFDGFVEKTVNPSVNWTINCVRQSHKISQPMRRVIYVANCNERNIKNNQPNCCNEKLNENFPFPCIFTLFVNCIQWSATLSISDLPEDKKIVKLLKANSSTTN